MIRRASTTYEYGEAFFADQPGYADADSEGRLFVSQTFHPGDAPGVVVFDRDGTLLGGWSYTDTGSGALTHPTGLLIDDDGIVYVGDAGGYPDLPGHIQKHHVEFAH